MRRIFLSVLIFICLSSSAFAKTAIIGATGLTGGGTGALDAIECDDILGDATNRAIATGDFALVMTSGKDWYVYRYNAAGTSSESSPDIIVPDDRTADCSGNGQWELVDSFNVARTATPQTVYKDSDCTDSDDNVYWTVNCTDTGSGTEDCDISLYQQIAGAATLVFQMDADGYAGFPAQDINLGSGKVLRYNGTDVKDVTQTLTNKTVDADDNVLQDFPFDIAWSIVDPNANDIHYIRLQRAVTMSSVGCIVDPEGSGESVVLDIQECDSNGDNCATVLSATITCGNTPTAGTLSDTSWAASAFIKIDPGTVTGTVKTLSIYGVGKQSF